MVDFLPPRLHLRVSAHFWQSSWSDGAIARFHLLQFRPMQVVRRVTEQWHVLNLTVWVTPRISIMWITMWYQLVANFCGKVANEKSQYREPKLKVSKLVANLVNTVWAMWVLSLAVILFYKLSVSYNHCLWYGIIMALHVILCAVAQCHRS